MVFSINNLNIDKSNTPKTFINKTEQIYSENSSIFFEMLDMISQENKQFYSSFNNIFSVKEGYGTEFLKNTISKIDFKKILNKLLTSFVDLLNKAWDNIHAFLLNLFGNKQVIAMYKDKLKNVNIGIDFEETRYIYTNLGMNTSYTSFRNELEKEFSNLILDLSKFRSFSTREEVILNIQKIKDDISSQTDYYDILRGRILGKRDVIQKEQFTTELFKYFRNDSVEYKNRIEPKEINMISERYFNYQKTIKEIERDKSDMIKASKKLQRDINSISLESYTDVVYPDLVNNIFVDILSDKSKRINETCNLYLQLFAAKLDAVKERYIQDQKILVKVIKETIREGQ